MTSSSFTFLANSISLPAIQGGSPTTNMYKVAPSDQMSQGLPEYLIVSYDNNSGAINAGVPLGTVKSSPFDTMTAVPKSAILVRPSAVNKIFSGLISR